MNGFGACGWHSRVSPAPLLCRSFNAALLGVVNGAGACCEFRSSGSCDGLAMPRRRFLPFRRAWTTLSGPQAQFHCAGPCFRSRSWTGTHPAVGLRTMGNVVCFVLPCSGPILSTQSLMEELRAISLTCPWAGAATPASGGNPVRGPVLVVPENDGFGRQRFDRGTRNLLRTAVWPR